ncbi:MAG: hypothetical protein WBP18_20025, partial [Paracoccaceae bacterium]
RALFRNRDFRLLLAGASCTNLGDGVMLVASLLAMLATPGTGAVLVLAALAFVLGSAGSCATTPRKRCCPGW